MTRVSVGLPIYNGERYLEAALTDLLAQTHEDLDVVISDNGSTDRTQEICESYAARDPRIRYVRQPANQGAAWNHNEVIRRSMGPYFRWYSYDDRLEPTCIEACASVLDERPDVVLAWPRTSVIDADGNHVGDYRHDLSWDSRTPTTRIASLLSRRTDESLLHMCYPVYGVVRLDVLRETRLLGRMPGADTVLLVELALRGPWVAVPERLFHNRRHVDSSAMDKTPEQIAEWFDPGQGAAFPMPFTRQWLGYLTAVLITPLTASQRLRAGLVVVRWLGQENHARVLLGELRIRLRQSLGSRGAAAPSATTSASAQ